MLLVGFLPLARFVAKSLGLDRAFANSLATDAEGRLSGTLHGLILDAARKQSITEALMLEEGLDASQVVCVGDGANDLHMLHAVDTSVAFCAKPRVHEAATFAIKAWPDMRALLHLVSLSNSPNK